jgi:UDP-N-acetylmuramate dehydrogenase
MALTCAAALERALGPGRVKQNVPLADLTTFKVGGPADLFVDTDDTGDLLQILPLARASGVPVTVIGGGSNLLVADEGVRGLVVRLRGGAIAPLSDSVVRADAGVSFNALVRWAIARGLAGLEAWAGTPGTVGGAIHGNAHYGGRSVGDLVDHVRVARPDGSVIDIERADMAFAYDRSRLQTSNEILLWAAFALAPGADPAGLRAIARTSLASRKRTQPLDTPSAGCIFQNPGPADGPVPQGVPPSAGALIDRAGLKGRRIGGASVSTTHGNFIVNEGGARADDIRALIRLCQREVLDRFGVRLREEIVFLGRFDS